MKAKNCGMEMTAGKETMGIGVSETRIIKREGDNLEQCKTRLTILGLS